MPPQPVVPAPQSVAPEPQSTPPTQRRRRNKKTDDDFDRNCMCFPLLAWMLVAHMICSVVLQIIVPVNSMDPDVPDQPTFILVTADADADNVFDQILQHSKLPEDYDGLGYSLSDDPAKTNRLLRSSEDLVSGLARLKSLTKTTGSKKQPFLKVTNLVRIPLLSMFTLNIKHVLSPLTTQQRAPIKSTSAERKKAEAKRVRKQKDEKSDEMRQDMTRRRAVQQRCICEVHKAIGRLCIQVKGQCLELTNRRENIWVRAIVSYISLSKPS